MLNRRLLVHLVVIEARSLIGRVSFWPHSILVYSGIFHGSADVDDQRPPSDLGPSGGGLPGSAQHHCRILIHEFMEVIPINA